jgi:branched-chain amino acid transport system permease protein
MIGNLLILVDVPALGLQLLIDGILVGAVFALAAYGMALVWGVTNIVNVTQGEFVMLGGFITVLCAEQGVPPLLAVPIAAAALYALGWVLFQTVIVHLIGRDMFNSVLVRPARSVSTAWRSRSSWPARSPAPASSAPFRCHASISA